MAAGFALVVGAACGALAIPAAAPAASGAKPAAAPGAARAKPAAGPGTAGAKPAAAIRLSHACYQTAQQATVHGSGFDPSAQWAATLDGSKFGKGMTDSSGGFTATFGVPSHLRSGSTGEDSYKLVVRERAHSASATFLVTKLTASFSPTSGNLSTLEVRFRLLGWGRGGSVYVHYVSPKGKSRLDRYLGASGGACGHLTTTPLTLFPFTPSVGVWKLQFDKVATYKAGSVPRVIIPYKIS